MSLQATNKDDTHRSTRADIKATAKKPSFFKLRVQMLERGRTNTTPAVSESIEF